jgi:HPt (histidine-containing phosphotransfer) domain-containing protein
MKEMFLANGFDDFLSKPIDTVRLNTLLEKWVPKDKQYGSVMSIKAADHASSPTDIAIAGLNTKKGIKLSGSIDDYYEILAIFYDDWLERGKEITKSLDAGDLSLYTTIVHALKGSAATIGADNLSEAAYTLEMAGVHSNLAYIRANNNNTLQMLMQLLENIDTFLLSRDTDDDEADKANEAKALANDLKELKSALEAYDFERINKLTDELSASAGTDRDKKIVKRITKHIMLVEYEDVNTIIDSYIS